MSNDRLEKLISQCNGNDVDGKVGAVAKLQAEFEAEVEITDPEPLIATLKSCLRHPNQHLSTATLSALPPFLNLVVANSSRVRPFSPSLSTSSTSGPALDGATLRQVMNAFLPSPGVFERLGDAREKSREKARETLVMIGGFAFRCSPSGSRLVTLKHTETPIAMFERLLKENGLSSKVWRVREQAILVLVHLRRSHSHFPIRPYLSLLVDSLEDTDSNVRACAIPSVTELFTGPGVTDAARADLKKEMAKKGVRKTIVDSVLAKLMNSARNKGASTPQSEYSDYMEPLRKEPAPSWRPTVTVSSSGSGAVTPITRFSKSRECKGGLRDLPVEQAMVASPTLSQPSNESMSPNVSSVSSEHFLQGKETEHNWAARERAIQRVRGMLKGDIHTRYPDVFLQCLKDGFIQNSLKTLASLRTTVASSTCSLYTELALSLRTGLDPFYETLVVNLIRMAGFTKKIIAQQSQQTLTTIIQHASVTPSTLQDKNVQTRVYGVGHMKDFIQVHGVRSRTYIESAGGVDTTEKALRKALADPNPSVRESGRGLFWAFNGVWHERAMPILESLDATARKQLEKACPDSEAVAVLPPTTPTAKKSSVAAAIAATMTTSPPTLRHQATSSSHSTQTTSPPAKRRVVSPSSPTPNFSDGRSSPSPAPRLATSPRSSLSLPTHPRSRILSNNAGTLRSVSASASTFTAHSRTPSDSTPTSPTDAMRRRRNAVRRVTQPRLHTPHDPSAPNHPAVPVQKLSAAPNIDDEESLLLPINIPIPDDSDSDMGESDNLISFSTPYKMFPPTQSATSLSTPNTPNEHPPVEDALRARAEQAQSAAERLLELTDSEEEGDKHPAIPTSVQNLGRPTVPTVQKSLAPPITPDSRNAAIFRQAALFKNSPINGNKPADPLIKPLKDQSHENGWWLKKGIRSVVVPIDHGTPLKGVEVEDRLQELHEYINALEQGNVDARVLQKLSLVCTNNPIPPDSASPLSLGLGLPSATSPFLAVTRSLPPLIPDMWKKDKNFERLFDSLMKFLQPSKDGQLLEYALVVVWEIINNQTVLLDGRESDLFAALFRVRYSNTAEVLEATKTIRDALAARIEPVYGLTTMHSSLRSFLAEPASDPLVKAGSHAFGLIALGKFILRLPVEVLEEELPRLKQTFIAALNDVSTLVVREAAYAAIIAAQLVLRDEGHLFALLDGLDDNKKNLLTYYFEKHGARGLDFATMSESNAGMTKLEGQMGRLDKLMNTPRGQ
ncbi:clasp N terminal-domain-containing protein [Pisolithus croceorrhizus]|nr:clasp N terminal-domain-containing protein [Pisolithus croceorrhizus]